MIRKSAALRLVVLLFAVLPGCLAEGDGPGVAPPPAEGTPTVEAPKGKVRGPRISGTGQEMPGMGIASE